MAHWLRDRGIEAYAVRGGVAALTGEALEVAAAEAEPGAPLPPQPRILAALRHQLFRRYSAGILLSLVGNWVEAAAYGYVVLLLGGSAATLGLIGFLNTIPNLIFALPAGLLADRYDRRKVLFVFQGLNMVLAAALAATWATGTLSLGLLMALAVVGGILGTMSFPAFQGMLAATVPRGDLESAVAINSLSLQVARFVGPALAGFLLATAGPTWVFGVNAASFVFVLVTLALLPAGRAAAGISEVGGSIRDAIRFVFGQRSLASLMALMLLAGMFGTPPVQFMIPAIVRDNLHRGGGALGAIAAMIGLGSVIGSVALLRLARRPNKGEPLLVGYFVTGVAVAVLGLSHTLALSLALGLVGGFFGVLFVGLSTVVVQAMSPDDVRARAMAIWAAAFVGMLPFGALVTAGLTLLVGPGGAVFIDGVVVVVGAAAVLVFRPQVAWLGCAALPESCIAGAYPAGVAAALEPELGAA